MRAYRKHQPPAELGAWQANVHDWRDFAQDAASYTTVKAALMAEQQQLCCYCEWSLVREPCHIEHLQPRHGPDGDSSRTFEYTNLACSCNGGSGTNRHCGHHKGDVYDRVRFIIPSAENSDRLLVYTMEGHVGSASNLNAADQERGRYTIRVLNLDCPRLANMRRSHANGLMDTIQGLIDADAADQIGDLALFYVTADAQGRLQPFFSLSRQIFGARADAILEQVED